MLQLWKVLETKITYQDPWIRLRSDRCLTSRGAMIEAYHILEFHGWINVIGLTPTGEIVLVREYRHGAGKIVPGLPSGSMHRSETNPEETARRELQEETGFVGGDYFALGNIYANPGIQNNRIWTYLAIGVEQGGTRSLDPTEDIEVWTEPFAPYLRKTLEDPTELQAPHLAALHLTMGFILRTKDERLLKLRAEILKELAS